MFDTTSIDFRRSDSSIKSSAYLEQFGWKNFDVKPPSKFLHRPVTVASLRSRPSILLAAAQSSKVADTVRSAAFYAYLAGIPWGVVISKGAATVFNSQWGKGEDWYSFTLDIDDIETARSILSVENLIQNKSSSNAQNITSPDRILIPVDDSLVGRLELWRRETLKHVRFLDNIDDILQRFVAQVFVIRMLEDRNIISKRISLLNCIGSSDPILNLRSAFNEAKNIISDELYDLTALDSLPQMDITELIRSLYYPSHLPGKDLKYDFSVIDSDILGATYEKYLGTIYRSIGLSNQPSLFFDAEQSLSKESVRKESGTYYTPQSLVDFIVNTAVDKYLETHQIDTLDDLPRIADIACGSGSFLLSSAKKLISVAESLEGGDNWGKELIERGLIRGIDIDERAANLAKLSLWMLFSQQEKPLPLPHLNNAIKVGDSLSDDMKQSLIGEVDIVVGNPPFLPATRLSAKTYSDKFFSARGRYDFSYLFVEQALNIIGDGGIIGFVTSNHILKNRDASALREFVDTNSDLYAIVDFRSIEVFTDASVYVSVFFSQKSEIPKVKVLEVRDANTPYLSEVLSETLLSNDSNNFVTIFQAPQPKPGLPWIFLSDKERKEKIDLEENGYPLSDICQIRQGIKTGANDIFVLRDISFSPDTGLISGINGFGDEVILESSLLKPVIYGGEIKRYDVLSTNKAIIYPYINSGIILEANLCSDYPKIYSYLERYKDILSLRSGISHDRWYDLTRSRDASLLERPKLAMKDLGKEPAFGLDKVGGMYIIGGTILIPEDPINLNIVLAFINSPLANDAILKSAPNFRGGYVKIEPQHLKELHIPKRLIDDSEIANEVTQLVDIISITPDNPERAELISKLNSLIVLE